MTRSSRRWAATASSSSGPPTSSRRWRARSSPAGRRWSTCSPTRRSSIPASRTWRRAQLGRRSEAERLLALQRAAYAEEARVIGFADLPPLGESVQELQACGGDVWLCEEAGELVGAVGAAAPGDAVLV